MTKQERELQLQLAREREVLEAETARKVDALAADESMTDDEYDAACNAIFAESKAASMILWKKAFFLSFPAVKSAWFCATFVPSFGLCESRRISAKQAEVFRRYCVSNEDTWKTGKSFCRTADGLHVTLSCPRYADNCAYVTIERL